MFCLYKQKGVMQGVLKMVRCVYGRIIWTERDKALVLAHK